VELRARHPGTYQWRNITITEGDALAAPCYDPDTWLPLPPIFKGEEIPISGYVWGDIVFLKMHVKPPDGADT
jgi:hypothetical protein